MRTRSLVFATLAAAFSLGAAAPAFADRDDWRRHEWREHEWREHRAHEWRERHDWDRGYYLPPPVVVGPPAAYYAPPPPVYYNPGVSFGVTIH